MCDLEPQGVLHWTVHFDDLAEWAKDGQPYFFQGGPLIGEYDKDAKAIDALCINRSGLVSRAKVYFGEAAQQV